MDAAEEQEFITRRLNQIKEQKSRVADLIPAVSADKERSALHRRVADLEQEQREAEGRLQSLINEQQKTGWRVGPAGS
jgi:predicted  nucleic acid-binding Zn-ribbon protein